MDSLPLTVSSSMFRTLCLQALMLQVYSDYIEDEISSVPGSCSENSHETKQRYAANLLLLAQITSILLPFRCILCLNSLSINYSG